MSGRVIIAAVLTAALIQTDSSGTLEPATDLLRRSDRYRTSGLPRLPSRLSGGAGAVKGAWKRSAEPTRMCAPLTAPAPPLKILRASPGKPPCARPPLPLAFPGAHYFCILRPY